MYLIDLMSIMTSIPNPKDIDETPRQLKMVNSEEPLNPTPSFPRRGDQIHQRSLCHPCITISIPAIFGGRGTTGTQRSSCGTKKRTSCLNHPYDIEYDYTSRLPIGFQGCFVYGATGYFGTNKCPVGINSTEGKRKFVERVVVS